MQRRGWHCFILAIIVVNGEPVSPPQSVLPPSHVTQIDLPVFTDRLTPIKHTNQQTIADMYVLLRRQSIYNIV